MKIMDTVEETKRLGEAKDEVHAAGGQHVLASAPNPRLPEPFVDCPQRSNKRSQRRSG
jgi:hypothetical protein